MPCPMAVEAACSRRHSARNTVSEFRPFTVAIRIAITSSACRRAATSRSSITSIPAKKSRMRLFMRIVCESWRPAGLGETNVACSLLSEQETLSNGLRSLSGSSTVTSRRTVFAFGIRKYRCSLSSSRAIAANRSQRQRLIRSDLCERDPNRAEVGRCRSPVRVLKATRPTYVASRKDVIIIARRRINAA
jgi:hypothetical protein